MADSSAAGLAARVAMAASLAGASGSELGDIVYAALGWEPGATAPCSGAIGCHPAAGAAKAWAQESSDTLRRRLRRDARATPTESTSAASEAGSGALSDASDVDGAIQALRDHRAALRATGLTWSQVTRRSDTLFLQGKIAMAKSKAQAEDESHNAKLEAKPVLDNYCVMIRNTLGQQQLEDSAGPSDLQKVGDVEIEGTLKHGKFQLDLDSKEEIVDAAGQQPQQAERQPVPAEPRKAQQHDELRRAEPGKPCHEEEAKRLAEQRRQPPPEGRGGDAKQSLLPATAPVQAKAVANTDAPLQAKAVELRDLELQALREFNSFAGG